MKPATKQEKLDLIQETVEFYKKNRICVDSNGNCEYYSESMPYGCAVGRLFKTENDREKFNKRVSACNDDTGVDNKIVFNELPAYIKRYGQNFLIALQKVHDYSLSQRYIDQAILAASESV